MKKLIISFLIILCIFSSGCAATNLYVMEKEHFFLINAGDKIVRPDGTEEIVKYNGYFVDDNTGKHMLKARFK